jgi:hypothetical protein
VTIRIGETQNFWKEDISLAVDIGLVGMQKGFDWPNDIANKIVMYNEDQPNDIHGLYSPAFKIPEEDAYESFDGAIMLTDIIEHNGLMWIPIFTAGPTRFSNGRILGILIFDVAFPRFNGEEDTLYIPIKKSILMDDDPGGGFGAIFGEDFGGPFGAEIKPFQYAEFISNDLLFVQYSHEDKALFKIKYDYFVQDDDNSVVYVLQDYESDLRHVIISDSIQLESRT